MKKLFSFLSIVVISNTLFAQIPNSGFEAWTTVGTYDTPVGWDNLDSLTNSMSVYTCEKGPGYSGSSCLKLTSKNFGAIVAPGIAVSGKMDMTTYMPKSGFAYTSRPANLTGSWQHMVFGGSQGSVTVFLSKWNSATNTRDTVAFVKQPLGGMAMSWTTFTIPLTTYYYSSAVPDSAIIILAASGATPANNDYLWVDNLAFTGTAPTGISNIANNHHSLITVYPNPAIGTTTLLYNSNSEDVIKIFVDDINGRNITSLLVKTIIGENSFPINISDFAKGVYFMRIIAGNDTQIRKLVVE